MFPVKMLKAQIVPIKIANKENFIKRVVRMSGGSDDVSKEVMNKLKNTPSSEIDLVLNRSNSEIFDLLSSDLPTLG